MLAKKKSIQEEEKSKVIAISIVTIVIMILVNLLAYPYMPKEIALKSNGTNVVPKMVFVFILPCLSIIASFINLKMNNRSKLNSILTSVVLLAINVTIIFSQI